ncbi:MAG: heme-binding protein [Planctomycetes bacterium]|nr:heme-binding protein [Planctomycetota bacterium]
MSRPLTIVVLALMPWVVVAAAAPQEKKPERGDARSLESVAPAAERLTVLKGFNAELVYSVPAKTEGSWVSLTVDPKGRLITSDQYGRIYRVTPAAPGRPASETVVEPLEIEIGGAQGLLCAFDRLYVMVNGKKSGLYSVTDTDDDDKYDKVKKLRAFKGAGEHGPHAVVLSPDRRSLYVCAGNHTKPPKFDGWLLPPGSQEDLLLPRMWDARGHAAGILAPGGWIARTDPEGKEFTLVSAGFRNEYDIAFNAEGELFTFDADMEWDIGTPWYRPTRVNHVTSGSEFGWRSGTGKWPAYYPDSLPAVVDIGPGSPTGIVFGTGTRFPAKYQRALYICDWSYGVMYAVHMTSSGASYTGTAERFVSGVPLPVTDVAGDPREGTLWFTIGGRRAQSGLYRVSYVGDEATKRAGPAKDPNALLRAQRAAIERFHGRQDPVAVATVWPFLSHSDRHLRYAARIALEHQPVARWGNQAFLAKTPDAVIQTSLALARVGDPALKDRIIHALAGLRVDDLDTRTRLDLVRAFGLVFARMGKPSPASRDLVLESLAGDHSSHGPALDREIAALSIYLEAPRAVASTLPLLHGAATQEDQIFYALSLRKLAEGWTRDQRKSYFSWFQNAAAHRGGMSFGGFLKNIRKEAIGTLDDETREALASVLSALPNKPVPVLDPSRKVVAKWTLEKLLPGYEPGLTGRSYTRGRKMFATATCFKCHRFNGEGGTLGPDLTGVSGRYGLRDLLTHVIDPAKEVSDQYRTTLFFMKNDDVVDGRVVNISGERIMVSTDMMDPSKIRNIKRKDVDVMRLSNSSQMPTGLLDTLSQEEIKDLMAFLISRGDAKHAAFQ